MNLNTLEALLKAQPKDRVCKYGFSEPHSYRGYYNNVSFSPNASNITIAEMLEYVEEAFNNVFTGWKGGEYRYNGDTPVYFAFEGCTSKDDNMPIEILESILGEYDES